MANDFALGKALEIPQNVLKDIDAIDKKINNISTNAERMAKAFNSAFSSVGGDANIFAKQLTRIQEAMSKLGNSTALGNLNKGLGNTASQAEKVVNSVTRVATTMNKLASSSNSGFSPNSSILAWQGLQKNIEQIQQRQEQLLKVTREYENELMRINSGKGGVLSKSQTESYQNALKEIDANKQVIASYREKQQAIIAYQAQQRQELQNLQALKNYESQRTSLPEQRSANELKRLNDYYRELEKSSAKAAAAQEKAAQRQQQAAQQQDTRINNKAIDAYNRAMAASEALVTQRINKIAKLRQAEEMLTATGRNYTAQLQRIQSEISRLNKLNEGQIRANGQIIRSQHNLMDISGQLARKLALVFSVSQISSYLIKLRDVTGEFELQNTALASILKNQNQADILFQQITDLAVRSPFTVKQLTTYTKSLSAYGFEYEKLYDTTKRLADVAAGLGVDMQRIILAYGQVSAANFLRGCLGYGTPVMLYDGTIKQVQDIVVGDVLINEKGEPVNVLELIRGRETMFLVEQVSGHNRTSYRVNRNHILTLWNVQEQRLEDVYVYDYLKNTEAYLGLRIVDGEKVYYDIEVTKDRIDDYYGFVLDGNKRFRLGDGTITHNTETRQFSEAGLNILKELAEYYSEVEGRAVSLGEVQDRQFKKMISFQDVEEVFKRITSEGGTFYQMQERQAETIAGQVSNLQDSIDIMLNSIGQANRETILTMISAVKSLVENWQIFADMLNGVSVFMTVYTAKTLLAAAANGKFSASALAATASAGGLRGALATVLQGFQSIFNFAKANPWLLLASGVVFLGSRLYTHAQNVKEAKKQYDLLTKSLNGNKDEFNSMIATIQNQNKAIEDANKAVKKAGDNTSEYASAQEQLRKETDSQATNIEKLSNKFPQIADSIKKNADGTYDLAEATKAYNEAMEGVERITYFAKNTETFWNDGLKQNIVDATEAQGEYNQIQRDGINVLKDLKIATNDFFNSAVGKHYPELQKEINNILNSSDSAYDKFNKIRDALNDKPIVRGAIWNSDVSDAFHNLDTSLTDTKESYDDLSENIEDISKKIREEYDLTTEEGKKKAKEYTEEFIRQLNIQNEEVRKFVEQEFTIHIGVQIDTQNISSGVKLGAIPLFSNVERRINAYLKKNKFNLLGEIKPETGRKQYSAQIKENYEEAVKEREELRIATEERYDNISNANRIKYLDNYISQAKQYLHDWEGYVEKSEKKRSSSSKKNPELDRLREMISLIQKAQDEYEKLRDYESEGASVSKVKEEFRNTSIGNILSGLNSFDTQSIIDALEQLRSIANKSGKDGRKALEEAMRPLEIQLRINLREEQLDKIKEELDEAFEDYDLSKDLLGTGFDANFIKTVFNVPITSLNDLKKKLQEIKPRLVGQGKEYEAAWNEAMKKVTELQDKELLERTKKYAEYLKYQYSEATKIMLQLKKDMAEVDTLNLTDMQKQSINQRLQEEANKKLQEQTWKDFQGSDMYTQMFDDLSKVSTKGLDYMVERLEELKGSLNDLDPSDLKEIINQINKIEEEQIKRNPFKGLGSDIKDALEFAKQRKELEEQITGEYEKQKTLIKQIPQQEQNRDTAENIYNMAVSTFGKDSNQAQAAAKNLSKQEETLAKMKEDLSDSEKKAADLKNKYDEGAQAAQNVADKIAEFANKINQAVDSMQTLVDGLNSVFNMSDGFNDTMSSIMEFGTNMANTITNAGAAYASFATGDIFGGITQGVSAIGGLFSSIGSLFNIGDKKKEREIKKQLNYVEDLQHAYEKLETAIDDAYSLDTYKAANDKAKANLEEQRDSLEKALEAAKSKKKVDKEQVEEIEQQIEEVDEQLEQLAEDAFNKVSGDILNDVLSAAEEFTNAWLKAFNETGDGMQGLKDSFNDMIATMLKRQASMLITSSFIENWKKQLQQYLNEDDIELTTDEAKKWVNSVTSSLPALNDALENYFNAMKEAGIDLNGTSDDKLSELQRGIQGITEVTAQALEALLESIRFYIVDDNQKLTTLLNSIMSIDSSANPMLAELQSQTVLIRSIEGMMNSVIKVSGSKGRVLRVEIA